jgi:hypothetical protein
MERSRWVYLVVIARRISILSVIPCLTRICYQNLLTFMRSREARADNLKRHFYINTSYQTQIRKLFFLFVSVQHRFVYS